MSLSLKLKTKYNKALFEPGILGLVINPFYIIRSNLYVAVKALSPAITGKVLDIGCGSKPYENLFSGAEKYIGCDIEISGHDHRNSKVDQFYDGRILPFGDSSFDSVVSFETFEHIFNLKEILSEIYRVSKPDSHLLISVPFAWDEHETPYDFARYTSFGISHLLKEAGFDVIELRKTASYDLAISQLLIAFLVQHVFPQNRILQRMFQIAIVFPLTVLALIFHFFLPKRYSFFCNSVVLAKKRI